MSNMKKHDENKFYQEYICRAVIEKIKPDLNFVKFESPDFFDTKKEIGMEVTIAEVANSYSNSMKYAKLKSGRFRDCEKATRELLKNGKMTKAGYISNSFDPDPCDSICKGVNKKMKKLESWFYNYKKHWLVLSLKMPLYEYTEKIRNVVVKENIDKEFYFDKVFVVATNRVIEIESKTGWYNVTDFTPMQMSECYHREEKEADIKI